YLERQRSHVTPVAPTGVDAAVPNQRGRSRPTIAVVPIENVGVVTIHGGCGLERHRLAAAIRITPTAVEGMTAIEPPSVISAVVADAPVGGIPSARLGSTAPSRDQNRQGKTNHWMLPTCCGD